MAHRVVPMAPPSHPSLHLPVALPHPHQLPRALGGLALPLLAVARRQPSLTRDQLTHRWGHWRAMVGHGGF
jgi:hypothetical protein